MGGVPVIVGVIVLDGVGVGKVPVIVGVKVIVAVRVMVFVGLEVIVRVGVEVGPGGTDGPVILYRAMVVKGLSRKPRQSFR